MHRMFLILPLWPLCVLSGEPPPYSWMPPYTSYSPDPHYTDPQFHTPPWNKRVYHSDECYEGDGSSYRGTAHFSYDGYLCLAWSSVRNDEEFWHLDENFCRNPNVHTFGAPWCYIKEPPGRQLCAMSRCPLAASSLQVSNETFPTVSEDGVLIKPYFFIQSSDEGAQYAGYSMDADLGTFSSTNVGPREWIGYVFSKQYNISSVSIIFQESEASLEAGESLTDFVEIVVRSDIPSKSIEVTSSKVKATFVSNLHETKCLLVSKSSSDYQQTRASYSCGMEAGVAVFVRCNATHIPLRIAELSVYGEPVTPFNALLRELNDEFDAKEPLQHHYRFNLDGTLNNNVLIIKENSQYLDTYRAFNLFHLYPKLYRDRLDKIAKWIVLNTAVHAGIMIGGCPHFSFAPQAGVCDGSKTEQQYNTWYIYFSSVGLQVFCDGTLLIRVNDWKDYCTFKDEENELFVSSKVTSTSRSLTLMHEPGFIDFTVFPLGDYQLTGPERLRQKLADERCQALSDEMIVEKCQADMFSSDGVVNLQAAHIRDGILHDFNSSIHMEVVRQRIISEHMSRLKSDYIANNLTLHVEERYDTFLSSAGGADFIIQSKIDLLNGVRKMEQFKRHRVAKMVLNLANYFYSFMHGTWIFLITYFESNSILEHQSSDIFTDFLKESMQGFVDDSTVITNFTFMLELESHDGIPLETFEHVDNPSQDIDTPHVGSRPLNFTQLEEIEHYLNYYFIHLMDPNPTTTSPSYYDHGVDNPGEYYVAVHEYYRPDPFEYYQFPPIVTDNSPQFGADRSLQYEPVQSPQVRPVQSPQFGPVQSPQSRTEQSPQYGSGKSPRVRPVQSPQFGSGKSNRILVPDFPSFPSPQNTPFQGHRFETEPPQPNDSINNKKINRGIR